MPSKTVQYDGTPSPLVLQYQRYAQVPKDRRRQKRFRQNIRKKCGENPAFREKVLQWCAEDPLFFINAFCYLVEPRQAEVRLFNTWPHQDTVIAEMVDGWGKRDFVGKKSREQGATWIMAALFVWAFTFLRNQELRFASKDDETMDEVGNMDSFGAKLDFLLERLPHWMRPQYQRSVSKHTFRRTEKGRHPNVIKGYSATAGIARGGRATVMFKDESAFWPVGADYEADAGLVYVTDCQIDWCTPNGKNNAFHDKVHGDSDATLLVLDFLDNPVHGKGKYAAISGKLEIFDGEYDAKYPYVLDGLTRTPWGDKKWVRHGRDNLWLARELYMDFGGSKGRPFPPDVLERARKTCMPPLATGMLLYDSADPKHAPAHQWITGAGYKFDLWRPVDQYGKLHVQKPLIGLDISMGNSGDMSSNSVLSVWDAFTCEQVGELAVNSIPPQEFARLAVAVAWWLSPEGQTFVIWEKNGGAGSVFTDEMMRLNYPNVYLDDTSPGQIKYQTKKSDRPGYHNSNTARAMTPLLSAMERNYATFRSFPLISECSEYEINDKSKWIHPRSTNSRDSSALGEGHGDRAIAAAMAFHGMRERAPSAVSAKPKTPRRSFLGRLEAWKEAERKRKFALSRW